MKYLFKLLLMSAVVMFLGNPTFAQFDPSNFEITKEPSNWTNTKVKNWDEYSYLSVEFALVNPEQLQQFRFSDFEMKDQKLRYLNIYLSIPKSENGSWLSDDVIFPLYFWELSRGENMVFTNDQAQIINAIPLRNSRADLIRMRLDADALKEDEVNRAMDRVVQSVANLAGTNTPNALTMSNCFVQEYSRAALAFNQKLRSSTIKKYAWNYRLNAYPMGEQNRNVGVIKQVSVFTLKPKGVSGALPQLNANVKEFKSINDVKQNLSKQSKSFPQLLIIYRASPFNFGNFDVKDLSDATMKAQKKLVYELSYNQSLSSEEDELLRHIIEMKEQIQSLSQNRDAYYLNRVSSGTGLGKIMEDYYTFKIRNNQIINKYRGKEVFATLKNLLDQLDNKASNLLTENVGGNHLRACKAFFDQFFEYNDKDNLPNQTARLEKAHRELKYFDTQQASFNSSGNNGVYHPSFEGELNSLIKAFEYKLYEVKYKNDCENIKNIPIGPQGDAIKTKLSASQKAEICVHCSEEIEKAVQSYDNRIMAEQLQKANNEYNSHRRSSLKLLKQYAEVNAKLEGRLDDDIIKVETILDLSKAEFKKLEAKTEQYISLITEVPNTTNLEKLSGLNKKIRDTTTEIEELNQFFKSSDYFKNIYPSDD